MPVHHATDAQTLNAIIQQVWQWGEFHPSSEDFGPKCPVEHTFSKNV